MLDDGVDATAGVLEHRAWGLTWRVACRGITRSLRCLASASRRSAQRPGERLDNQRSLAREFGVTLMTLRQALELLERDGLITRRHGLGTFVARARHRLRHPPAPRPRRGSLRARRGRGDAVPPEPLRAGRPPGGPRRSGSAEHAARLRARAAAAGGRAADELPGLVPAGGDRARRSRGPTSRVTPLRQVLDLQARDRDHGRARDRLRGAARRARRARAGLPARRSPPSAPTASRCDATAPPIVYDRVFIPGDRFRITRDLSTTGEVHVQRDLMRPRTKGPGQ